MQRKGFGVAKSVGPDLQLLVIAWHESCPCYLLGLKTDQIELTGKSPLVTSQLVTVRDEPLPLTTGFPVAVEQGAAGAIQVGVDHGSHLGRSGQRELIVLADDFDPG